MPHPIERLLDAMARLRDPAGGCPWDRRQSWKSLVPHTLEEAYEIADAAARDDAAELREELGDLLFHIAFYARIAEEQGRFTFVEIVEEAVEKLIRRHPHVFGGERPTDDATLDRRWEEIKARERDQKRAAAGTRGEVAPSGALEGVARALPALLRAEKIQRRAARVGFDWEAPEGTLDKVEEEAAELRVALRSAARAPRDSRARGRVAAELGDLLFSLVNLARWLEINPETALRETTERFERRFAQMERDLAAAGRPVAAASAAEREAAWGRAKREEARRSERSSGDGAEQPEAV